MPGQWEFQVGPTEGIAVCDHLWIARYILYKVAEEYNISISLAPKLFEEWNGAGCHSNFSTKKTMSGKGGMEHFEELMKKMEEKHDTHIKLYGEDNDKRLTGNCETASMDKFTWGVGDRSASVRINGETAKAGAGYFEDRRPSSNMDPYVVSAAITDTCLLDDDNLLNDLVDHYETWLELKKGKVMEL